MRKLRFLSLLLLSSTFIAVSCTKEGPEGPAGVAGTQGPAGNNGTNGTNGTNGATGATGPIGPQGPAGPTGTANVIYSSWLAAPTTFGVAGWFDTTITTLGTVSRANFAAPSMTQAIIDQGLTLVYHTFAASPALPTGGGNAQPLPFLASVGGGNFVQVNHRPAVGRLIVYLQNVLPATGGFGLLAGHYFRYIIVPGGVSGGRNANQTIGNTNFTAQELQNMTYEQALQALRVPASGAGWK